MSELKEKLKKETSIEKNQKSLYFENMLRKRSNCIVDDYASLIQEQCRDQFIVVSGARVRLDTETLKGIWLVREGKLSVNPLPWLFVEEVLYLLERGSIICETSSGDRVSVWELYYCLSHGRFPLTISSLESGRIEISHAMVIRNYITYAFLRRAGYSVIRNDKITFSFLNLPVWCGDWIVSDKRDFNKAFHTVMKYCSVMNSTGVDFTALVDSADVVFLFLRKSNSPPAPKAVTHC